MGERVFIISGEESGDLHGASLIAALKKLMPSIEVSGMGGQRMRQAGQSGLDSKEVSVVGVVEVVEKLPKILKTFKELKERLRAKRFDAVILIDFPDFNLRFAKEARRQGVPVIYYISPQVWAWRKDRVKKIARLVDKMLVVFPFEAGLYEKAGVDVEYVGHPLGGIDCPMTKAQARGALGVKEGGAAVAILPGSRTGEIRRLLGGMLRAGELIEEGLKEKASFILPAANSVDNGLLEEFLGRTSLDVKVVRGQMYTALRASDAAIVASGTATLETALIGTPMVIVYRMSALSHWIAKALVGIDDVGLPNIVAGRRVVPELIQDEASPRNIAREALDILKDGKRREAMTGAYSEIRKALGGGGAADKAAAAIKGVIARRRNGAA